MRLVALVAGLLAAGGSSASPPQHVGASKCKVCHMKEFNIWSASSHASALNRLSTEERQKPECLTCHVTGYGKPAAPGAAIEGVQCEACHGPGGLYKSLSIMSKKAYESDREAAHKKALDAGLVVPTEATCRTCHNEKSPNFKGFDFKTMSAKIKHW